MTGGYFGQQPFGGSFGAFAPATLGSVTLVIDEDATVAATGTATLPTDFAFQDLATDFVFQDAATDFVINAPNTDIINLRWI